VNKEISRVGQNCIISNKPIGQFWPTLLIHLDPGQISNYVDLDLCSNEKRVSVGHFQMNKKTRISSFMLSALVLVF